MNNNQMIDFRNAFFDKMHEIASFNEDLVFLTGDISAHSLPKFIESFPSRFYNTGIAEQNMIATAAGLSMGNKKVFAYSMIPFLTMRSYEHIKIDICSMSLPVTLIGLGSGLSYNNDGPTAQGIFDVALMRILPGLTIFNPSDPISASCMATLAYEDLGPTYVRLDKSKQKIIYNDNHDFNIGINLFDGGNDLCIISTGIMVHKALEISEMLKEKGIHGSVIDIYRLKPINNNLLVNYLSKYKKIVTLEENSIIGGLGSIISETMIDYNISIPIMKFALKDEQSFKYGERSWLHELYKIDNQSVVNKILFWENKSGKENLNAC